MLKIQQILIQMQIQSLLQELQKLLPHQNQTPPLTTNLTCVKKQYGL